jgi:hypothetical protein
MYINFSLLKSKGLNIRHLGILLAIKQKEFDLYKELFAPVDTPFWFAEEIDKLLDLSYIQTLKSKSGVSISKSGTALLKSLEIAGLNEEHKDQYAKFVEAYTAAGLPKEKLGNTKRGLEYYVAFVSETNYSFEEIYSTIESYIEENSREPVYVRKLSDLLCKQDNVYSTRFDLSKSKLYNLIKDRS